MNSAAAVAEVAPLAPESRPPPEWSLPARVGFRFAFVYFVVVNVPFPLNSLPLLDGWLRWYEDAQLRAAAWFGTHVLGVAGPISLERNGSGDKLVDWCFLAMSLSLTAVVTAIWSLTTRRRSHPLLLEGLRVYLRLVLAMTMLSYGFAKIFKSQFPTPGAGQLLKPYGDGSPMNLLWTFMGFSTPYTIFAGLMETIPAVLLVFRRTMLTGSLLLLGVMGNVVLLNFCYDVPVKIYSTQLWLTALFLALPDVRRLFDALVLGRAVGAAPAPPPLARGRWRIAGKLLFAATALAVAVTTILGCWESYRKWGDGAPRDAVPIRGTFRVTTMTLGGVPRDDLAADESWTRVWIRSRGLWIYWESGKGEPFRSVEEIKGPGSIDLSPWGAEKPVRRGLLEAHLDGDLLTLEGTWDGKPVRATATRVNDRDFLLMNRGFHWVNEVPFNR